MTDQTPEARLAAARWQKFYSNYDTGTWAVVAVDGKGFIRDDIPVLVDDVSEATADALIARLPDPRLCPDPAAHEGVTFTVDSLAAVMWDALEGIGHIDVDASERGDGYGEGEIAGFSAAIIKAAKEASATVQTAPDSEPLGDTIVVGLVGDQMEDAT